MTDVRNQAIQMTKVSELKSGENKLWHGVWINGVKDLVK